MPPVGSHFIYADYDCKKCKTNVFQSNKGYKYVGRNEDYSIEVHSIGVGKIESE